MSLNVQFISLLFSLIFGFIFSSFIRKNEKIIYSDYLIVKYAGSILIISIGILFYFIVLQSINYSSFHFSFILMIIIGFIFENKIYNCKKK